MCWTTRSVLLYHFNRRDERCLCPELRFEIELVEAVDKGERLEDEAAGLWRAAPANLAAEEGPVDYTLNLPAHAEGGHVDTSPSEGALRLLQELFSTNFIPGMQ